MPYSTKMLHWMASGIKWFFISSFIVFKNMKNRKSLVLTLLKTVHACDSIQCSRPTTLWRVFQLCRHSFHIECKYVRHKRV